MNSTARWLSEQFRACDFIHDAHPEAENVRVIRGSDPGPLIGVLRLSDVERADVQPLIFGDERVDFVLNVPKTGRFMGDAIELLAEEGVGWGGLGDAMRALRDCGDLGDYEHPELRYVMRGLRQHQMVTDLTLLDDHRIRVLRRDLPALVIYVGSEYQPTVESVRTAIDRFDEFDIFAATNPNSDPTAEAVRVADQLGIRMLKWGPTLAALRQ